MEGAAVYINSLNKSTLIMYKEFYNKILIIVYTENQLYKSIINNRDFTHIIPKDCVHILTKLPYDNDLYSLLRKWKIVVKRKLESLL